MFSRLILLLGLMTASLASAAPVNWSALGLDSAQITGVGQTITNFNGVSGLTAVITGSSGFTDPYIHVSGQLLCKSTVGTVGSIPPTIVTVDFNQPVALTLNLAYFGDGYVRESLVLDSLGSGLFNGSIGTGGTLTGDGTGHIEVLSADNYPGSPASFTTASVTSLQWILDGADGNDIAGVTLAMDLELGFVANEDATWGGVKSLFR